MKCDRYQQYELGELDEVQFKTHAKNCPECQSYLEQDARLLALARTLQQPVVAPQLWERIEHHLRAERKRPGPVSHAGRRKIRYLAAAVLVLGLGLGTYLASRTSPGHSRLLTASALRRIEDTESEYRQAIADLERVVHPQLAHLDPELTELYQERLAVIDEQIARCRAAQVKNPANAHICRYLLAALQDKKQTLQELVSYQSVTGVQ